MRWPLKRSLPVARKFDHFDLVPADDGFYPRRCLDVIDEDQVLDTLVCLSSGTFDRAQDTRIAGCRRHNSDERLAHAVGRAPTLSTRRD
jgi:hypothetical protein